MVDQRRIVEREQAVQQRGIVGRAGQQFEARSQIGMCVQHRVGLARRRLVAVAPTGDAPGQRGQFRPQLRIGDQAGGDGEKIEAVFALRRAHDDLAIAFGHVQPWRTQMQCEAGMRTRALEGVVGRRLVVREEAGHHPILVCIRQRQKTRNDAGLFHVPERIDAWQFGAAHEHLGTGDALFQRKAGIVEGRGAAAQNAHTLAGQCGEIDVAGRVRVAMRGQGAADPLGHDPLAPALNAGGQNQLACEQGGAHRQMQAMDTRCEVRLHADHAGGIAHRQAQRCAIPAQIIHPARARNLVQRVPSGAAVLRLPPRAKRERWHAQIDRGDVLGRAQGLHARVGDPRAFLASRVFVDHQHVVYTLALQRERRAQAALAGADDDHVVDVPARMHARLHPGIAAVGQALQVVGEGTFEVGQAHDSASRRR